MSDSLLTRLLEIYHESGITEALQAIIRFIFYRIEALQINLNMYARHIRLKRKYEALPDPHHTIHIDPRNIDKLLFGFSFEKYHTYVRGGKWDTIISDDEIHLYGYEHEITSPTLYWYDQYIFAQSLKTHFENGVAWEKTRLFKYLTENRELVEQRSGNYSDMEERLSKIDDLYDEIKENGYQEQEELSLLSIPLISTPPNTGEIKVAIGRDGEIFFVDGRHRFVIARILGIESIPAKVVLRHTEWMELRNELSTTDTYLEDEGKTDLRNHPDLVDISDYRD